MVVNDELCRVLYEGLVEKVGPEVAGALMDHLPPAGWSDLATKSDVALLGEQLRHDMADLRADLRGEMVAQTRTLMIGMVGTVVAALGTVAGLLH